MNSISDSLLVKLDTEEFNTAWLRSAENAEKKLMIPSLI